jgi:hypothetical protein
MMMLSTSSKEFLQIIHQILEKGHEILLLIRYPSSAGNRDYYLFDSLEAVQHFISLRKAKETITVFKSMETVKRGQVSTELLLEITKSVHEPKHSDWLVIFPNCNSECWNYCENQKELLEELKEHNEEQVVILEDPLFQVEEETITAYVPDRDGVIRPGPY